MIQKPKFAQSSPTLIILFGAIIASVFHFTDSFAQTSPTPVLDSGKITNNTIHTAEAKTPLFTIDPLTDANQLSAISATSIYSIDAIDTYRISFVEDASHVLTVARYHDHSGKRKQAIVYLPAHTDDDEKILPDSDKAAHFRYEKWLSATEAIKEHTDELALFLSYWDNGQRIDLFTGREAWVMRPDPQAYQNADERKLWATIAGGIDTNGKSKKYSHYLLQDFDTAITSISSDLRADRDVYLLVSTDDLLHIQEIAALSERGLPLETRLFVADGDVHNNASRIKEWAREDGATGSYLVQPVSGQFFRAWRITDKTFEDKLLIRLLPFTSSLDKPLNNVKLVYQSDWGAYLSIYQLEN